MEPTSLGKLLVLAGVLIAVVGLFLVLGPRIPFLGRLPGDLHVEREGFSFHFPLMSCIVLSLVISFLLWVVGRIR